MWMGLGRTGQVGPSAPRRVVEELKLARDPVPIHLLKATDRVARERWRRLGLVLRILVPNVSFFFRKTASLL